jgi:hypothetical protein
MHVTKSVPPLHESQLATHEPLQLAIGGVHVATPPSDMAASTPGAASLPAVAASRAASPAASAAPEEPSADPSNALKS